LSRPEERNARRKERALAAKRELEKLFHFTGFFDSIGLVEDRKRNTHAVRVITFSDHPPPFEVPTEIDGIKIVRHETKMIRPR